jgi:iron complex transport system ATP-binding protein
VFEFVLMGRYPHLSPFTSVSAEDKRVAQECLTLSGVEPFADRLVHTLSGGERQGVFIAAALAQGARILLLDEPTTFLDYRHQVAVQGLLRRLNREQRLTIAAVTHDVTAAVWSSTRVLALKEGRLVFDGSPERLESERVLETVYDTPIRFVRDAGLEGPLIVPVERSR